PPPPLAPSSSRLARGGTLHRSPGPPWVRVAGALRPLGVELWQYAVRLERPHGEEGPPGEGEAGRASGCLTREEYERHTKEIRFRMYRCLLERGPQGSGAVILGHHLDDIDENRLDHLQKGHFLGDVEGMREWREIHGVPLLRPLLRCRKEDFQSLLAVFPVPFLRDSTPAWSVRGGTRAVLESLGLEERGRLTALLDEFGALSAEVGGRLDEAVRGWAETHARLVPLPKGASGLLLDLGQLFALGQEAPLERIAAVVDAIREAWNPAALAAQPSAAAEIPESHLGDAPWLLFERGFFAAAGGLLSRRRGHYHTSEGLSVNRRAVRHLYDNMRECARPHFSGGLTQELGYVHVAGPPRRALLLYDASAHPGVDFKAMRATLVQTASRA
ncbi:unnamed protein product, partial [Prorocentrum cordatum]